MRAEARTAWIGGVACAAGLGLMFGRPVLALGAGLLVDALGGRGELAFHDVLVSDTLDWLQLWLTFGGLAVFAVAFSGILSHDDDD